MKLFAKLKNDKKGFTLVEMIVVIVIIGILLAILVPGMFKYIDKAKDKQIMVEARSVYMDVQTAAAEAYGTHGVTAQQVTDAFQADGNVAQLDNSAGVKTVTADIEVTSGVKVSVDVPKAGKVSDITIDDKGKVIALKYTVGGKTVSLSGDSWTEPTEVAPSP